MIFHMFFFYLRIISLFNDLCIKLLFWQSKTESGKYILGHMIVPQTFKKVSLTKEGTLKTETFMVLGCKILLLDIRKKILDGHESLGLMQV